MKYASLFFGSAGSWLLAFLLITPVLALILEALTPAENLFNHLWHTVLGSYILNSTILVTGVAGLGFILAMPAAWIMATCSIPGRRQLQWLLVLPMAMPSYVIAYIYTDLLEFAGPVQRLLRTLMGWRSYSDYSFPEIRSLGGAVLVLSLILYPYLYLLARTAFLEQSQNQILASRLLGCSPSKSFFKVSLPMARPAIMTGLALIGMETLGDFGAVSYFSLPTLTTAVYDTWLGYGNIHAAAKISIFMLLAVVLLISLEKHSRRKQQLYQKNTGQDQTKLTILNGWHKYLAIVWCWTLVVLGFFLPVFVLTSYLVNYFSEAWRPELLTFGLNSLLVAGIAACLATFCALLLSLYQRLSSGRISRIPARMASTGYAIPGNVLAIGIIIPLSLVDHRLNELIYSLGFQPPGLILSGSIVAIIYAYTVRFSAITIGSLESSFGKISPSLDMASQTLGCSPASIAKKIHIPLIRKGLLTGLLLVFIEAMKELPATILIRPFNFETLATRVFQYVSDENLEYAAPAALILVLVGMIPLIFLNQSMKSKDERT